MIKEKGFRAIGASNHATHDRETNDFYATDPKCGLDLIRILPDLNNIWECACGEGHLSKAFGGKVAKSSDLIYRGYGTIENFLEATEWHGDIVTNPPYSLALEFAEKALSIIQDKRYYCAFLKLVFLEGAKRKKFFEKNPPKFVYVYSSRQKCALGGHFEKYGSTCMAYAWFVWQKGFVGETRIRWI